jgi:1,4-alpha-glucan branching enzyme
MSGPNVKPWLLAGLAIVGVSCASRAALPPRATPGGVQFELWHPTASNVALAGSFNEWSLSTHPLAPAARRGNWRAVVALPPGEHLFMYVVNGTEWVTPPVAEDYADDGFGSKNGIVVVRQSAR